MVGLFPRWAVGLSDPLAHGAFYEGNLELDVEPMALLNLQPRSGWAAGGALLLHYNLVDFGSIVPFVEAGGGAGGLRFHFHGESDGLVFPLQASIGFHALTFSRGAFTTSVGYYHLSNAGLRHPNQGVNAVLLRIGFTAFSGDPAPRAPRLLRSAPGSEVMNSQ